MEDGSDPGNHLMSDQEIIETVMQEREDSDLEDEDPSPPPTVTHFQACEAFECALQWLESQGDTDPAHLMLVKKLARSCSSASCT